MGTLISEFDYFLPDSLIAQDFRPERDESRLLVIKKENGSIIHGRRFRDLPDLLQKNDILLINDTSVIPARLSGMKSDTGAKIEFLVLKKTGALWEVLVKPARRVKKGCRIIFSKTLEATAVENSGEGRWTVDFSCAGDLSETINRIGAAPVPPYIKKKHDKNLLADRYQTVYAKKPGAIAAPTAGLHFTVPLMERIKSAGVIIRTITLHTGTDTFKPVKSELAEEHKMGMEFYEIPQETASTVNGRKPGQRIIAVGTTVVRAIEGTCCRGGMIKPGKGWTDVFIYPGFDFKIINGLITNFHPPRSTPLLMTAAFCGKNLLEKAYREAVEKEYMFLSFGDATFIT